MEPVDSERDVSIRSTEPLIIFNAKLLDCCVCFQPLSIPVFQCDNGHLFAPSAVLNLGTNVRSCDFVASSEVLSNHFRNKHGDSQIEFYYGRSFVVSLKSNDETIVFQEKNDGKLFILNNSTMSLGNMVNICCIWPNSFDYECDYKILAKSRKCRLKLHSIATNVQRFTLGTHSSEFLMIPIDSLKTSQATNLHKAYQEARLCW
ncbi:RING-type E3 ubiquitin transferase [Trifolium repens]|nr:RING-type E3 ubiquitin transferase [Trifolium repens]